MRRTTRTLALIALAALTGCSRLMPPPTADPVVLHLYATLETAPLVTMLAQGYRETHPGIVFDTVSGSHDALMNRLAEQPEARLFTHHLPPGSDLWAAPLAQDGLVVITHPSNPVNSLTPDEVRRLYQGFTVSWSEIGGTAMPVQVISLESGAAVRAEFERLVMGQRRIAPTTEIVPSPEAAVERVATQPGAVASIPLSLVDETVKVIAINGTLPELDSIEAGVYPLRMTIFILAQQPPDGAYVDFINWIQSEDGQNRIRQTYAPLPD